MCNVSDNVVIELPDFDAMLREANGMLKDTELGLKLDDKIADYSEQFTPYNTGELFDSLRVEPFKLVYDCDYAEEVYDSDNLDFNRNVHNLATNAWVEVAFGVFDDRIISDINNDVFGGDNVD